MWPEANQWWFELNHFFQAGGWVLYLIFLVAALLNILLLERILFRVSGYKRLYARTRSCLQADVGVWEKRSAACDLEQALNASFPMIRALIALCPLVGLLGTVSGMIQVFDSLAIYGTGNPRMMASGVARAILPTMTGMAVAVLGLLVLGRLQLWTRKRQQALAAIKSTLYD